MLKPFFMCEACEAFSTYSVLVVCLYLLDGLECETVCSPSALYVAFVHSDKLQKRLLAKFVRAQLK